MAAAPEEAVPLSCQNGRGLAPCHHQAMLTEEQSGQRPRLGGNAPFLVDRENERLIRTATSVPVARQIADHERRLRREAHARNTAAKQAAQQRRSATPATAPVRCRPSGASNLKMAEDLTQLQH